MCAFIPGNFVAAFFEDQSNADDAIRQLQVAGFTSEKIDSSPGESPASAATPQSATTTRLRHRYAQQLAQGGSLILVNEHRRVGEAEEILSRNKGQLDRELPATGPAELR